MENFLDMVAGGQMSQIITKMEQSPPATTLPILPTHTRIKIEKSANFPQSRLKSTDFCLHFLN